MSTPFDYFEGLPSFVILTPISLLASCTAFR